MQDCLLDHMVTPCLVSWRTTILLSTAAAPFAYPPAAHKSSSVFTSLSTFAVFCCFDRSHPKEGSTFHCGFDLHHSDDEWCWASSRVLVVCVSALDKYLFKSSAYCLIGLLVLLLLRCRSSLHILDMNPLYNLQMCSPILWVAFVLCCVLWYIELFYFVVVQFVYF